MTRQLAIALAAVAVLFAVGHYDAPAAVHTTARVLALVLVVGIAATLPKPEVEPVEP